MSKPLVVVTGETKRVTFSSEHFGSVIQEFALKQHWNGEVINVEVITKSERRNLKKKRMPEVQVTV